MGHKNKQLLLQDLTGRLPYGVIVQVNDGLKGTYDSQLVQVFCDRVSCSVNVRNPLEECICIDSVKPYLRPMLSMTEEEHNEWYNYYHEIELKEVKSSGDYLKAAILGEVASIDYLNKKMFDYRGLITNGLAISTDIFNPYKD